MSNTKKLDDMRHELLGGGRKPALTKAVFEGPHTILSVGMASYTVATFHYYPDAEEYWKALRDNDSIEAGHWINSRGGSSFSRYSWHQSRRIARYEAYFKDNGIADPCEGMTYDG